MKNSQKEREAMLHAARTSMVSRELPAIHPRYRTSYNELYREKEGMKSSLGIRILISLFLFASFAAIDQGKLTQVPISPSEITYQIEAPFEIPAFPFAK